MFAIASVTVKKFCATPCKVKPALAVKVIVAVYWVDAAKVACCGFHVTTPVYCAVSVIAVTGVPPTAGGVTPGMAAIDMAAEGVLPVAGNAAETVPEFAALVAVAPATVKQFCATPKKVKPALTASFMVAV